MSALATLAAKLASDRALVGPPKETVLAFAARLSREDALEVRRLGHSMMDERTLADLGLEDPRVAAAARHLVTARQMEIAGEPILEEQNPADPYAGTRGEIRASNERGDAQRAAALQAGLDAMLAKDAAGDRP